MVVAVTLCDPRSPGYFLPPDNDSIGLLLSVSTFSLLSYARVGSTPFSLNPIQGVGAIHPQVRTVHRYH